MLLNILKSKIHRVQVTEANLEYIGSITIDEALMEEANIYAGERVQVVDNNNGARLETYVIPGKRGSGCICINGQQQRIAAKGRAGSSVHGGAAAQNLHAHQRSPKPV